MSHLVNDFCNVFRMFWFDLLDGFAEGDSVEDDYACVLIDVEDGGYFEVKLH